MFTVDDGWGYRRRAGWHVCKRGDRFAALQPISMGLAGLYGSTAAARLGGWPCGWITAPSICRTTSPTRSSSGASSRAFVAEPQTNGVAERFNRTLKEQIIHGRIYRNIAELRDAVRDLSNSLIVEKNGAPIVRRGTPDLNQELSVRRRQVTVRP